RHRPPRVGDDELRHREIERVVDDERTRAGGDGLGGELVPIPALPANAEEERAGHDGSRVVGEVDDIDRGWIQDLRWSEGPDEPLQVHGGRVYQGQMSPRPHELSQNSLKCGTFS